VYATCEPEMPRQWNTYSSDWLQAHGLEADFVVLAHAGSDSDPEADFRMDIIELGLRR
jgi:hypothetical protein